MTYTYLERLAIADYAKQNNLNPSEVNIREVDSLTLFRYGLKLSPLDKG